MHQDNSGKIVGKSQPGFFGSTVHRSIDGKTTGHSVPGFWGSEITTIDDGICADESDEFDVESGDDSFFASDDSFETEFDW